MQNSNQRPANLYSVKVKDKVKQLEASLKPAADTTFLSPRPFTKPRTRGDGKSPSNSSTQSSVNASAESIPAVMDVEQIQVSQIQLEESSSAVNNQVKSQGPPDKPLSKSPRPSLKLKLPLKDANISFTNTKDDPCISESNGSRPGTPSTPTDVKSLLKKFSSGVSNTLRRMSSGTIEVPHLRNIPPYEGESGSHSPTSSVSSHNDGPTAILKEVNGKRSTENNDELCKTSITSKETAPEIMSLRKRLSISFRGLRSRNNSVNEDAEEEQTGQTSQKKLSRGQSEDSCDYHNKASSKHGVDSEGLKSVKMLKRTFERSSSFAEDKKGYSKSKPVVCNAAPVLRQEADSSLEQLTVDKANETTEDDPGLTASLFVIGQKSSGKSSIVRLTKTVNK